MKKTLLTALAATLALGVASPSLAASRDGGAERGFPFARMMERFDINADGVVTADEVAQQRTGIFESVDADNSGTLSEEEFAMIREMRQAQRDQMREERMEKRKGMREQMGEKFGMRHGKKGERGEGRHGRDDQRMGMRGERGERGGPSLATLDTDKDGQISLAEFQAGDTRLFARFDRNGDKQIDVTDFYKKNQKADSNGN